MLPTRVSVLPARSSHVGSGATGAREPSQVREEAALSGSAWVPPGRLACAASGPLLSEASPRPPLRSGGSGGVRERPNRHAWKACVGQLTVGSNPSPSATSSRQRLGAVASGCRARPSDLAVGRELDRRRAPQRSCARSHCVANEGGLVVEVPPALLRDGPRVPGVPVGVRVGGRAVLAAPN